MVDWLWENYYHYITNWFNLFFVFLNPNKGHSDIQWRVPHILFFLHLNFTQYDSDINREYFVIFQFSCSRVPCARQCLLSKRRCSSRGVEMAQMRECNKDYRRLNAMQTSIHPLIRDVGSANRFWCHSNSSSKAGTYHCAHWFAESINWAETQWRDRFCSIFMK